MILPNQKLGRYTVIRRLGQGAQGTVFLAMPERLPSSRVAIKVLVAARPMSELRDSISAFSDEIGVLSSLHHPNIAEILDFGTEAADDGTLSYFVMRYVRGRSLASLFDGASCRWKQHRPPADMRRLLVARFVDVAAGLAYVHGKGIVHCDVKPSNIVFESTGETAFSEFDGKAVLVDFGLATPGSAAFGLTVPFASPEQIRGDRVTPASDVFSLGLTMWQVFSGIPIESLALGAQAGLPVLRAVDRSIDRDLSAILECATDPEPSRRYESGAGLRCDLLRWLEGQRPHARPPSMVDATRRRVRRSAARILTILLAVSVVVFGAATLSWLRQQMALAREATAASVRPDPVVVQSLASQISPFLQGLTLGSGGEGELVTRSRRNDPGDPWVGLCDRLARGDRESALIHAASSLRGSNPFALEPVRDWFVAAIRNEVRPDAARPADDHPGLTLLARLAYEVDAACVSEFEGCAAALRRVSWDALREPGRADEVALYAIAALGGFGNAEDVLEILWWGMRYPPLSEERRLTFHAVARILRREVLGRRRGFDVGAVLRAIEGPVEDYFRASFTEAASAWSSKRSYVDLLTWTALAARSRGWMPSCDAYVPREFLSASGSLIVEPYDVSAVLAAFGDSRASAWLLARVPSATTVECAHIGWCVGLLGDPEVRGPIEQGIEVSSPAGDGERISCFRRGLRRALDSAEGIDVVSRPDSDTCLSTGLASGARIRLKNPHFQHPPASPGMLVAAWQCRQRGPQLQAGATAIEYGAGEYFDEGESFLRLGRPGASKTTFSFEYEPDGRRNPPRIVLEHQAGLRPALPFEGVVFIDIAVDGRSICSRQRVLAKRSQFATIDIPLDDFGRTTHHEIRIALHASSTTTCRIYSLEVVAFRDEGPPSGH